MFHGKEAVTVIVKLRLKLGCLLVQPAFITLGLFPQRIPCTFKFSPNCDQARFLPSTIYACSQNGDLYSWPWSASVDPSSASILLLFYITTINPISSAATSLSPLTVPVDPPSSSLSLRGEARGIFIKFLRWRGPFISGKEREEWSRKKKKREKKAFFQCQGASVFLWRRFIPWSHFCSLHQSAFTCMFISSDRSLLLSYNVQRSTSKVDLWKVPHRRSFLKGLPPRSVCIKGWYKSKDMFLLFSLL